MKFHNHETMYEYNKSIGRDVSGDFYETNRLRAMEKHSLANSLHEKASLFATIMMIDSDRVWYESMRPYYKVWPSIVDSLCKINLDVEGDKIEAKNRTVCIRFPVSNEPSANGYYLETILATRGSSFFADSTSLETLVLWPTINGKRHITGFAYMVPLTQEKLSEFHSRMQYFDKAKHLVDESTYDIIEMSTKISLSVLLLADDPSIIEPDVLSKDELAYERTKDQKYVDKAHRRGKVGWHIGKTFESIPHYRRPHPALFHTGKGRTIPRIVFRSGCVVHRDKMTKVPTGYITPEGVEVEPK